jgi:two-component system chemotaxis sensor kinase CheA
MADSLLELVDAIREILGNIEANGAEGDQQYDNLVATLETLRSGPSAEPTEENNPNEENKPSETQLADASEAQTDSETPAQTVAGTDVEADPAESCEPTPALDAGPNSDPATTSPSPKTNQPNRQPESSDSATTERATTLADSTVRINVELLDKLMNLVGELVLSRNQILQFSDHSKDAAMVAASQRLNLITSELQEGVMKTRMQPIRTAWSKLPRVVRDLSATCGKDVIVEMQGEETELDKTILEAIKDPLTHIVRNSVDHGIESPAEREAAGKPAVGKLHLRAFHEGGQVNIEISDDGGGIKSDRVRDKAIEKGLITVDDAERMGNHELINLILLPGFSTAAAVTNVSGRGVGMDVVKTNIEKIGGTLEIQSETGVGTTLRIKIPLTLAIVPALIVRTTGEQFAIPQVNLLELVRLDSNRAGERIEYIHDTPVCRLRGDLLPLVYLDEQLELRSPRNDDEQPPELHIAVLQAEDRQFGLVVDAITDTQEIVVKPLGQHMKHIRSYAGATIMGDGTVALILDVVGLARKSNVLTETRDRNLRSGSSLASDSDQNRRSLLIVEKDDQSHAAIPLIEVARLEEFSISQIERSGNGDVVQYRNDILPLIYLSGYGADPNSQDGRLSTVVFSDGKNSAGVVVGKILDVVHERVDQNVSLDKTSYVINDRVTEIIDLPNFVVSNRPDLFQQPIGV